MCNISGIVFGAKNLSAQEIRGKRVIEVGSYDVNGSLRSIIESWGPDEYIGVDIEKGPNVDVICYAEDLEEKFGKESFDVVISTELLEHVKDWRNAISNMKNICKNGGLMFLTTRSHGFAYHGYPNDFWRFELDDMSHIFGDCEILALESDYLEPGVFIKTQKPLEFFENNLSDYELYSIVTNKKSAQITDQDLKSSYFRFLIIKNKLRSFISGIEVYVLSKLI